MSQAALAMAVCEKYRTVFNLTEDSCDLAFDGAPKPMDGELFIAVHPLDMTSKSGDDDLHEDAQLGVTITLRMGWAPKDRWGIGVWAALDGLEPLVRLAMTSVHKNDLVRIRANALITSGEFGRGAGGGTFFTPLWWLNTQKPKPQGPAWFSARPPEGDGQTAECGVSQMLTFGRAERCQIVSPTEME